MLLPPKVKVVIEVEISEQPIRDHYEIWGHHIPEAEQEAERHHNQALLDLLRSKPDSYSEFIRTVVVGSIEELEMNRDITRLSTIGCPYTASLAILQKLFPQLSKDSQQYFQQASQEGWLSEGVEPAFSAIRAIPISLSVEYPAVF